jgi:hypothetical protein
MEKSPDSVPFTKISSALKLAFLFCPSEANQDSTGKGTETRGQTHENEFLWIFVFNLWN